ncbi:MAG: CDP-glycerol glycerophosphotransferase family protein [Nocardioidaceae bacterium]
MVFPVSDSETTAIQPMLDNVLAQSHRNLDIVVVPFGRSPNVRETVRAAAQGDWRLRVLQPVDTFNEACNRGLTAASGEYLMFVRPGDGLPRRAVAILLGTLRASGSDFAVGALAEPKTLITVATPSSRAHQVARHHVTMDEAPLAISDLALGNRLFRVEFLRAKGVRFGAERNSTEHAMLAAYEGATFDLLREVTYTPSGRPAGKPIGAVEDAMAGVEQWIADTEATWRRVDLIGSGLARIEWLGSLLDAGVQPFLLDAERATPEQWQRLQRQIAVMVDRAGPAVWEQVRVEPRIRAWLAAENRREDLVDFVISRMFDIESMPTVARDGQLYAEFPEVAKFDPPVPEELRVVGETESVLVQQLRNIRWPGDSLELELAVYIKHASVSAGSTAEVALICASGAGDALPLRASAGVAPDINQRAGHAYADYARGLLDVTVDLAALGPGTWILRSSRAQDGLRRTTDLTELDGRGTPSHLGGAVLAPRPVGGRQVSIRRDHEHGFAIVVEPDPIPRVADLAIDGELLTGTIGGQTTRPGQVVATGRAGRVVRAPVGVDGRFAMTLPAAHAPWALNADGSELGLPEALPPEHVVGQRELVVERRPSGGLLVVPGRNRLTLDEVRLDGGTVVATGSFAGRSWDGEQLRLVRDAVSVPGTRTVGEDGTVTWRFEMLADPWGWGAKPAPSGFYAFQMELPGTSAPGVVRLGGDLLARLTAFTTSSVYRFRLGRRGSAYGVHLLAPLTDDERGRHAQAQLRTWCLSDALEIDPGAVYLQAYNGASATDSQLALHHELRRTHPELTLYWGVADRSAYLPEGAVPVVMHTREWYRVLGSAHRLVMNIDFERWFSRKPGQLVLQTFHGYPAKAMGVMLWEAKNYTPRRIELELQRCAADWDLILTPTPEMDVHYREQYRYRGAIHSHGYPRDDMLVGHDAGKLREQARARLGIGEGQTAVLYAPTWRDDQATTYRSAALTDHLDLGAASTRLGPEFVLLMRGHRFHKDSERTAGSARLIDVTDYPEINHLILASDAAVLDYSSLRFDYSLTGKPMIFLVPDLDAYTTGVRGFLFDYRETAPGPLLATTGEVVAALQDLEKVRRDYAGQYAAMHAKYNYCMDGRSTQRVAETFMSMPADAGTRR